MLVSGAVILNVDDNEPGRYAKSRILTRAGFKVYDAGTGAEALELAERYTPDLVLLDVNLPDVNGIEVCRRLKTSPESATIMVLQISAHAVTAPQATAALNSGADCYLTEPVDADVLVATVNALLRLRRAERDLAAANAELLRSNDDLRRFALVASHDLQEPLRSVLSFASLLERSAAGRLSEDEDTYISAIVEGGRRMRTLIDDLLTYSQMNEIPRQSRRVDLGEVFGWVVENLRQQIEDSKAIITSDELPAITGDEGQFRHLIQNLIGNAIKYRRLDVPVEVHISAEKNHRQWIVAVRDNGIGIKPEYREAIFTPFKRLHGREIPGTGIGLAVCRRVVDAHGGRIWVDANPAGGSIFRFTLPVIE